MANSVPLAVAVTLAVVALAQPVEPSFEVATVRHSGPVSSDVPPQVFGGPQSKNPERVTYSMMPLSTIVSIAYGVRRDQVKGPGWLSSERYNIVAKIPPGTGQEKFNRMLQNLIQERFHMRFHMESEIRPAYVLSLGKDGSKLRASTAVSAAADPPTAIGAPDDRGYPMLPSNYTGVVGRPNNGHMFLAGQRVQIRNITSWLETPLDRPIVDQTGLTGEYDFKMDFEWPRREGVPAPTEPIPSVFSAVEDFLGLKLEGRNVPFDVIVIDSMVKEPAEN